MDPTVVQETYYTEPFQALGIDPADGYEISAEQNKHFSNCLNEDNVCVPHAYEERR